MNRLLLLIGTIVLSGCTALQPARTIATDGASTMSSEVDVRPASTFTITRDVQILPYALRISKLRNLVGDAADFTALTAARHELGDFDYSSGVGQDLSWTQARLNLWIRAVQPICGDRALSQRYPFPADANAFLTRAYGRDLQASDADVVSKIQSLDADADEKFQVLCTVTLSSLEFVSL